jgi:hypothetical protein
MSFLFYFVSQTVGLEGLSKVSFPGIQHAFLVLLTDLKTDILTIYASNSEEIIVIVFLIKYDKYLIVLSVW